MQNSPQGLFHVRAADVILEESDSPRLHCRTKQPPPNVLDHVDQPVIFDPRPVVPCHRRIQVPHDESNCHLITRVATDRFEDVTQGIKPDPLPPRFDLRVGQQRGAARPSESMRQFEVITRGTRSPPRPIRRPATTISPRSKGRTSSCLPRLRPRIRANRKRGAAQNSLPAGKACTR